MSSQRTVWGSDSGNRLESAQQPDRITRVSQVKYPQGTLHQLATILYLEGNQSIKFDQTYQPWLLQIDQILGCANFHYGSIKFTHADIGLLLCLLGSR